MPSDSRLTLWLAPRFDELAPMRASVRHWMGGLHSIGSTTEDLLLALTELCTNAIQAGPVDLVEVSLDATNGSTVALRVVNQAQDEFTASTPLRLPDVQNVGGRGLAIVDNLLDNLAVQTVGGRTTASGCLRLHGSDTSRPENAGGRPSRSA